MSNFHFVLLIIPHLILVLFTGLLLIDGVLKHGINGRWSRIVAEWFTPFIVWVLFGVGSIINIIWSKTGYQVYSIDFSISTVIIMSWIMFIGGICYLFGYRMLDKNINVRHDRKLSLPRVKVLAILIILFDWSLRFAKIINGIYFIWFAKRNIETNSIRLNPLFQIQSFITYILIPILIYLAKNTKRNIFYWWVLFIHLFLIFLEGNRSGLLFSLLIFIISILATYKLKLTKGKWVFIFIVLVVFFFVISPIVQEARYLMKRNIASLKENPFYSLYLYFFRFMAQGISNVDLSNFFSIEQRSSLFHRLGSYLGYSSSIYQSMRDGYPPQGLKNFSKSLLILIPRLFYPEKPIIDADAQVFEHFQIGREGLDAAGTYPADIFSYLHVFGVIFLFFIGGVLVALTYNYLKANFSDFGEVVFLGLIPQLMITGDIYVAYFHNFRNIFIFLILLNFFFNTYLAKRKFGENSVAGG